MSKRSYEKRALDGAKYELLEDGTTYGSIPVPGFEGVYANAPDAKECARELQEVLNGWIALKKQRGLSLPPPEIQRSIVE